MNHQFLVKPALQTSCTDCLVREFAFFKPIKQELLEWESQFRSTQYELSPKQFLYREGDILEEVFTLHAGWVLIFKTLEDGKRQVLRIALPGEFLAYHPNMDDPIDHSAIALSQSRLCAFTVNTVKQLILEQPELSQRLHEILSTTMVECHDRMASIGQKTAIQRVASMFIELFRKLAERSSVDNNYIQDNSIEFPLTQDDIADAIGVTPVHVSRVTKELREAGIVDCNHSRMYVHDLPKLAEVAGVALPKEIVLYLQRQQEQAGS